VVVPVPFVDVATANAGAVPPRVCTESLAYGLVVPIPTF
jgi:hypothetical protein